MVQQGEPSSSDVTKEQDCSAESNSQDLCAKIKNSLKQLRRLSTSNEESSENNEKPYLCLEVFPEESENPADKGENLNADEETRESNTELLIESIVYKFPTKPLRKNPRQKAVINHEIQKSIIAAQKALPLNKVYVNPIENLSDIKTNKSKSAKKAHSDSSETPSHPSRIEQLYEFLKYVAKQIMCFDEKDFLLAQAEIKEVLAKFRLKYKIMNCLSKTSDAQTNQAVIRAVNEVTSTESQTEPTSRTNSKQSVTKLKPPLKRKKQSEKKSEISVSRTSSAVTSFDSESNSAIGLVNMSSQMPSAGPMVTPMLQVNVEPSGIHNNLQMNTAGFSGLPQMVSVVPTLNKLGVLNMNSTLSCTPVGFLVVPSTNTPVLQLPSQHVDSTETNIQPMTLQGNSVETMTQPSSSNIISTGALVTQPDGVNSDTSRPPYEMPPTYLINITPADEPDSLIIKCEAESDEET